MHYPLVSVVVTAYRRLSHLKDTLDSFRACCTYPHLEFILCDDGSPRAIQDDMRRLPFDVYVFAEKNQGLGVNVNRGLRIARGEYIFYLQDDWRALRRGPFLEEAVYALQALPELGCVRLRLPDQVFDHAQVKTLPNGLKVRTPILTGKDAYQGIYVYSQNPHLKRRDFHEKIGFFDEHTTGGTGIEDHFCRRFLQQQIYQIGMVEGHEHLFMHTGDDVSYFKGKGRWRNNLRHQLLKNRLGRYGWSVYQALPENARYVLRGTPARIFKRSPKKT